MALSDDRLVTANGLWTNGRNSILHALDHFSERDRARADRRPHHDKWIVLSVYHAAECICNMRLIQLEPDNRLFTRGGDWYPSLSHTLRELKLPRMAERFTPAERKLFTLMTKLPEIRHPFMHRITPSQVDVSIVAMCMIGLLKYIERLRGETASDIIHQSPPIEGDVVAAIHYTRLQEYGDFVALFLREKYGNPLPPCPACDVRAVVSAMCEACFTELETVWCPDCHEEGHYIALEYAAHGTVEVQCQHCGLKRSISRR